MMTFERLGNRWTSLGLAALCLVAGAAGGWWWQSRHVGGANRAAIESVVHDYLLEHPEVLPAAMEALQKKEDVKRLSGIRIDVEKAWPGEVLGNPQGKVTLVEFTDFACTYCRRSVADVEALIAANPDLKVVLRQLPIIAPTSADAARMGLAAAEQGKYAAFHKAMFAAGRPDKASIEAAARSVGIDLARAQRVIADPRIEDELSRNIDLARQLGFTGTPAWVTGDTVISGAVGEKRLATAIAEARG
ncbi:MAG: DsbA family protein [Novosphingobium sp.]